MRVYYNSSLWSKGKGPQGLKQRVNWQFEFGGANRYIPVIYRFPKGIVFDIVTLLDETKLREFFEKHEAMEKPTPLQRRCIEQEHPYQAVPVKEIWINGKRVEGGYSSSGTVSIPWARQDDELAPVRKAYPSILKDIACFACERFCVPYPETGSKIQKLMRLFRLDKVNGIKLYTHPVQRFFPLDIHFETPSEGDNKEICFKHPVTGIAHTMYFQDAKHVELPLRAGRNENIYAVQAMYEIEPALPQGDTLQFNSSIQYTEPRENRFSPTAASSIGIIGGACGPTAIFVSGKNKEEEPCGLHGLPLHSCFSVPDFHKEGTLRFVLEGISIKESDSREYRWS